MLVSISIGYLELPILVEKKIENASALTTCSQFDD